MPARIRLNIVAFLCCFLILILYFRSHNPQRPDNLPTGDSVVRQKQQQLLQTQQQKGTKKKPKQEKQRSGHNNVEMVIASVKAENVTWFDHNLPNWTKNIYVVDDENAPLTVPMNKGREAMVFLTYIIDRYDSLPETTIFHHAQRFQWHNDDPDYDALPLLRSLNLAYIRKQGYANLRCVWVLGCPAEISPAADGRLPEGEHVHAKYVYAQSFKQLFPGEPVPETVGVTCCSQFAATRETIRTRSKSDYIRYRNWLMESDLRDDLSGRVLEYSWHIIFGKKPIHCPAAGDCYCKLYGLCDLKCDEKECHGQYTLPPFSSLPQGWPLVGWNKEERHWNGEL